LFKLLHNFYRGKSSLKLCASSEVFKKLLKVNNHPTAENSPNLVTLSRGSGQCDQTCFGKANKMFKNPMLGFFTWKNSFISIEKFKYKNGITT
jgi:hypothetical protein